MQFRKKNTNKKYMNNKIESHNLPHNKKEQ